MDNLCYVTNSVAKPTKVQRIAIPNACFYRNNHYGGSDLSEYYGIEFGEDITYNKTAGTVKDTAFCVVSIDLDQNIIYAYCYGAGYDRIIQYKIMSTCLPFSVVRCFYALHRKRTGSGEYSNSGGAGYAGNRRNGAYR